MRFKNHVNTVADPEETDRYTRQARAAEKRTATYGTPCLLHRRNMLGACPVIASEYRLRLPAYRNELPALLAEVRMTALMIWFSTGMPAL